MDVPKPSCAHTRRFDVVCWRGYGAAMAPPRNAASTVRVLDGVGCMVCCAVCSAEERMTPLLGEA